MVKPVEDSEVNMLEDMFFPSAATNRSNDTACSIPQRQERSAFDIDDE